MKTSSLILFIICINIVLAQAQVPGNTGWQYRKTYPATKEEAIKTGNECYRTSYRDTYKKEHIVYCDTKGKVIREEYQLTAKDIPAGINSYYRKNYPQDKTYEVWAEKPKQGARTYYIDRGNEIIYFDAKGNYTKKIAISPE